MSNFLLNLAFCAFLAFHLPFNATGQATTENEYRVMSNPAALEKVCESGILICERVSTWHEKKAMFTYHNLLRADSTIAGVVIRAMYGDDDHYHSSATLAVPLPGSNAFDQLQRDYSRKLSEEPPIVVSGIAATWAVYIPKIGLSESTLELEDAVAERLRNIPKSCEEGLLTCEKVAAWLERDCTYTYTQALLPDGTVGGVGVEILCGKGEASYALSIPLVDEMAQHHLRLYRPFTNHLYQLPSEIISGVAATWPLYYGKAYPELNEQFHHSPHE